MTELSEKISMNDFVEFVTKYLSLSEKPTINFVDEKTPEMTSACYSPDDKKITILSKDRKFMDVARSIAHEMVHQKQHEDLGDSDKIDGMTGSKHEDEANAIAGRIIRKYGEKNPEFYTENYTGPSAEYLIQAYRNRK